MKASIIIVVHAGAHHLADCLDPLAAAAEGGTIEVVVVDNGSVDRCGEEAGRRYPWVRVVRSQSNTGFAGGVHLGAEAASGDVLVLLNDDAAAERGLVEAHLETLAANPRAAVSAGRLTSWDGRKHDFVRGGVTFDCHAFQLGQGFKTTEIDPPAPGTPLPFACGGNMAVRRSDWEASGGFDRELFAYFEDVDLGWRLWAAGREVVAAPDAVARHRGAATSAALGDYRRGVLFERNALRTFFACADDDCRAAFGPVVLATFLHRLTAFAGERPEIEQAIMDPFEASAPPPARGVRNLLARIFLGPQTGGPTLEDGLLLMQLRAARGFFDGLDRTEARRAELAAVRTMPDREILTRFPRLIVPTYAGDEELFESDAFATLLPDGWPVERMRLDEVMRP